MAKLQLLKAVGIIPARYSSSRFPGKPLAPILGKTLIQHTYESSKVCSLLDQVFVATDDQRIFDHVCDFGGRVIMTSIDCPTGTDRIIEAIENESHLKDAEIIVNIQGDQPCIEHTVIQSVLQLLLDDSSAVMSTAAMRINSEAEALNPSVVKCTLDYQGNALYFSRALIPASPYGKFNPQQAYYKHIGIYAFRRDFLFTYGRLPQTPLQLAEDLEQLKVLEHGYRIKTAVVESSCMSVDHPEDIIKVESLLRRKSGLLCKQNIYS